MVAIPSNRVNVSYWYEHTDNVWDALAKSQSPQIGSMFPTHVTVRGVPECGPWSQSPQIGSMFPTDIKQRWKKKEEERVAIPSNRVNVSYKRIIEELEKGHIPWYKSQSPQIGSMFPTI